MSAQTGFDLFPDRAVIALRVNGELKDKATELTTTEGVEPVRIDEPEGLGILRHSTAHVMAQAVQRINPEARLGIGPPITDGFYYDFDVAEPFTPEDLKAIEKEMDRIVRSGQRFVRRVVTEDEARAELASEPYKLELIGLKGNVGHGDGTGDDGESVEVGGAELTIYDNVDRDGVTAWKDLCRGPHVPNTGALGVYKLMRIAAAYWRGSEKNPQLQRIYGTAWPTKHELRAYTDRLAEAARRDHRKLGKELDLFTFSELVGSGLPLYTPRGTIMRDELARYSEELQRKHGFQKVWIPHITKTALYKTSGHWDKFGDELFLVKSQESSDDFVMKPMNCPHHTQIYASQPRSYRDLPIRYMETTTCYRDEKTGELSGLTRVRSLTQDDAHVFCTMEQIEQEFESIMSMIKEMYDTLGLSFHARLSFSDPKNPAKYLGEREQWEKAEATLENITKKLGLEYEIALGEAAFYGPKIDIMVTDAIGRQWQCATEQLDFVQPVRFGLEYTAEDGSKKTPVMIHKALLGTIDRFLGVYIEHTAGNFPLWLSPEQVRILPVSEKQAAYAESIGQQMRDAGIRVEIDAEESLGKRIRAVKMAKVPYFIVVGDAEVESGSVTAESRDDGKLDAMKTGEFITRITSEIAERA